MKHRIKKLQNRIGRNASFYAANPSDIFYLSGFSGTSARIVVSGQKSYFITDARYSGTVTAMGLEKTFEVIITNNYLQTTVKLLSGRKIIMINHGTALQDYLFLKNTLKEIEINPAIEELRMIKEPEEIRLIKKSVEISENGIRHIVSILKPGISEKDITLEFEYYIRKHGADGPSFEPIIAFGPGSAVPHHKTSCVRLRKNTLILMDIGARYRGYCSDLTRCVCFGIIKPRLKELQQHYNIVRNAKAAGVCCYTCGKLIKQADAVTRLFLRKQGGFDKFFTHSLGHSLGIDVHEPPFVNAKEKLKFKPGMVFSCEPGIYFEGKYGIRIEDDYLITEKGPEKLGKSGDGLVIAG